jgi:pteridine reductase
MPPLAIVTGAARRVGRAVAIELARAGFDVVLTWRTRRAEADATATDAVAAARAAGRADVRADPIHLDLSSDDSVAAFVARFQGRALDVLVLSASSYARTPFGAITAATAAEEWRVNAQSPLLLAQGLRGPLEASTLPGGSSIVAFTDIHAHGHPRRAYAPYLMSKAALAAMVECLAVEMAPRVRVNAIAPGVIAWPDDAPSDERARYEARIPLARPGTPEDAAQLVRAITLDMPYVTGTTIRLDGGRALR